MERIEISQDKKKQEKWEQGREWVKLRVGRKMYSCKYCSRQFNTSQALGGHQNTHKREKSMLQHCMAAAALGPVEHSSSYVHIKGDGAAKTTASALTQPLALKELPNLTWPGSSRKEDRNPPPDPVVLDLDLKL